MKVLIADDHTVVREGLKQILNRIVNDVIIEEASEGVQALDKIYKNKYDLVIMDISMPGKSGLDILKELKEKNMSANVLMLTIHPEEQYAIRAFKLGASGYLSKGSLYEELGMAIKTILAGKKYIPPGLAEKVIFDLNDDIGKAPHEKLSEREFQVMCMFARGNSTREIAEELTISKKTVSTHRTRLLVKMGMTKNAELISYAIRNNLIE